MLGAIVGAGASLLGGLFGGKKKEKTTTKTEVDYVKMAREARKAGFNPLTAIRNGGSAGFSTSTTTAPTASALPGALADVGGLLGNAFEKRLDPLEAKKRQLDTALVDYQLRQLKQPLPGQLYTGSSYSGTKVSRQYVPGIGPNAGKKVSAVPKAPYDLGNPLEYNEQPAQVTKFGNQSWWLRNPWTPDGATYEDAYGEVAGSALGITSLMADIGYNGARATVAGADAVRSGARKAARRFKEHQKKKPNPYGWVGPYVKRAVSDWFEPWRKIQ